MAPIEIPQMILLLGTSKFIDLFFYPCSIFAAPPRFCLSWENTEKQAAKKDVFQLFAEKVRDHKEMESRWAVLQETRVEYFRGKDLVGFLKNHAELKDILEDDNNLEVEDIANILLRKNLLVRCDRVVKTVRPGKKKLSTWPAHLEIYPVSCVH
ncbi:hypothetical protein Leryth_022055 [Lithospermum erythrorhizon]|nr:hypothetical protein Leryth_022055 [Lithospermum erythrorhizon]